MPQDFLISVAFTSDWHIGTGAGRQGHIDRLVRRDPVDNLPYVPGKTLTGILRDSCEAIADGLDKADGGTGRAWMALLERIFGDQPSKSRVAAQSAPLQSALAIGPAHIVDALLNHLCAKLARALTFVKPGVRINPRTGQALTDHLRMIEVARGGVTLVSEATLDLDRLPSEWREPAQALLWAGARSVQHIGGQRRRGLGRCEVTLAPAKGPFSQADLNGFKTAISGPQDSWSNAPDVSSISAPLRLSASSTPPVGAWARVGLELYVERPVVVPANVVGNTVNSLDYVPGTYLVGHVLRALTDGLGRSAFPHLASGEIRVLNAYLEVNGTRGRPVPLSYRYAKSSGGLDTEQSAMNALCEAWPDDEQAKPHRVGYLAASGQANLTLDKARFLETTHTTINDEQQRPVETEGGVFTYHALRPGTCLRSELFLTEALVTELDKRDPGWKTRLNGTARVGVAKKDDYGKVKITPCSADTAPTRASEQTLTVWLLSDLLLRDQSLRPSTSLDDLRAALEQALNRGCKAELPITLKTDTAATTRVRRREGWQTNWQLPKPTLVGLQAGSVVRFTIEGTPPPDLQERLMRLEGAGIGERRGEGFGELVVNDPLAASKISHLPGKPNASAAGARLVALAPAAHSPTTVGVSTFLTLLETEAWRAAYRHEVAVWASNTQGRRHYFDWKDDKPKNNQLGTLRQLAMTFRGPSTLVSTWLAAQGERDKWTSDSLDRIKSLVNDASEAWISIPNSAIAPRSAEIAGTALLRQTLWPEAVRTLLLVAIRQEIRQREHEAAGNGVPTTKVPATDPPAEGAFP